ncbi:hypothetical protein ACHAWC_001215 [Mediolabrus comicus]
MGKAGKSGKAKTTAKAVSSRLVKHAPLTSTKIISPKSSQKDDGHNESLSRGQRKRLAKREQYLKRERMVMSSLRLKRLEEQKGKLDGLDAIKEALTSTTKRLEEQKGKLDGLDAIKEALTSTTSTSDDVSREAQSSSQSAEKLSSHTVKAKKNLANSEIGHMSLVLEHPSFVENPFAAIQQHLRNSLECDAEVLKAESLKREKEDKLAEERKKEDRKVKIRDIRFSKRMGTPLLGLRPALAELQWLESFPVGAKANKWFVRT